ncbi:MAG: hypothetical protein U5M23_15725 [Marinagarivorans sp.]|nr:hypothetical protein [Marinagarivorans sp.]
MSEANDLSALLGFLSDAIVMPAQIEKADTAKLEGELSKLFVMLHDMKPTPFGGTNNGSN